MKSFHLFLSTGASSPVLFQNIISISVLDISDYSFAPAPSGCRRAAFKFFFSPGWSGSSSWSGSNLGLAVGVAPTWAAKKIERRQAALFWAATRRNKQ
jgi:hypothetical protein